MEQLKSILAAAGISQQAWASTFDAGTSTGDTLKDQQAKAWADADAYNRMDGGPDDYTCDKCRNKGLVATVQFVEDYGTYTVTYHRCECYKPRSALRRLKKSGLMDVIGSKTFDSYQVTEPWQQTLKDKAVSFARNVLPKGGGWFFLGGQSGCGKTHLCTAIAAEALRLGKEVRYMQWRDEVVRIKGSVTDPEAYAGIMDALKRYDVLYIDDLFKVGRGAGKDSRPTAADIGVAYELLNSRSMHPDLVTIISTEWTLPQLLDEDEALAGRIAEKSKPLGYCINVGWDPGKNWRMRDIVDL